MIVTTREFNLWEEAGVCFRCTAAGDFEHGTLTFRELFILQAQYEPRTGNAIPLALDAQAKIDTAERLAVSRMHRIMDELWAAVKADHPLHRLNALADMPGFSQSVNDEVFRRQMCARDAIIAARQQTRR